MSFCNWLYCITSGGLGREGCDDRQLRGASIWDIQDCLRRVNDYQSNLYHRSHRFPESHFSARVISRSNCFINDSLEYSLQGEEAGGLPARLSGLRHNAGPFEMRLADSLSKVSSHRQAWYCPCGLTRVGSSSRRELGD